MRHLALVWPGSQKCCDQGSLHLGTLMLVTLSHGCMQRSMPPLLTLRHNHALHPTSTAGAVCNAWRPMALAGGVEICLSSEAGHGAHLACQSRSEW